MTRPGPPPPPPPPPHVTVTRDHEPWLEWVLFVLWALACAGVVVWSLL